jgi:hypothetical protein
VAELLVGDRPRPAPSRKMTNFRKFWPKRGLKTAFSSANGGVRHWFGIPLFVSQWSILAIFSLYML